VTEVQRRAVQPGMTVRATDRRWGKLTTSDLTTFAKALGELGAAVPRIRTRSVPAEPR